MTLPNPSTEPSLNLLSGLRRGALLGLFILAGAGFMFFSLQGGLSVLVGGAVALANFSFMQRTARRALRSESRSVSLRKILAGYFIRFTITGILVYLLFRLNIIEPLGLLCGLSVVMLAVLIWGGRQAARQTKEVS